MKRRRKQPTWNQLSGLALALSGSMAVYADVIPENGSSVSKTGSVTQIDILTPDDKGTSYNRFSSFDVIGLVVNNSKHNTESQLLGGVKRNPSLSGGEARSIILDNIGDAPTKLNGLVEIAGANADLLMVGRNGISCNSCGFINANSVTLGAGDLERDEYGAYRLRVGGAKDGIQIRGAGLSAPDSNINLVAQQVELLAPVYGKDVAFTIVRGLYGLKDRRSEDMGEAFDATLGDYVGVPNVLADGDITVYTNARKLDMKNLTMSTTGGISVTSAGSKIEIVSGKLIANEGMALKAESVALRKTSTDSSSLSIDADNLQTYGWFGVAHKFDVKARDGRLEASSFDAGEHVNLAVNNLNAVSLNIKGSLDVSADQAILQGMSAEGQQARIRAGSFRMTGGGLTYKALSAEGFSTLDFGGSALRFDELTLATGSSSSSVRLAAGTTLMTPELVLKNADRFENGGVISLRDGLQLSGVARVENSGSIAAASASVDSGRAGGDARTPVAVLNTGKLDLRGDLRMTGLSSFRSEGEIRASTLVLDNQAEDVAARNVAAFVNSDNIILTGDMRLAGVAQVDNSGKIEAASVHVAKGGAESGATPVSMTNSGSLNLRGGLQVVGVKDFRNGGGLLATNLTLDNLSESVATRNAATVINTGSLVLTGDIKVSGVGHVENRSRLEGKSLQIRKGGSEGDAVGVVVTNADSFSLRDQIQLVGLSRFQNDGKILGAELTLDNQAESLAARSGAVFENNGDMALTGDVRLTGVGSVLSTRNLRAQGLTVNNAGQALTTPMGPVFENRGDLQLGARLSLSGVARVQTTGTLRADSLLLDNATESAALRNAAHFESNGKVLISQGIRLTGLSRVSNAGTIEAESLAVGKGEAVAGYDGVALFETRGAIALREGMTLSSVAHVKTESSVRAKFLDIDNGSDSAVRRNSAAFENSGNMALAQGLNVTGVNRLVNRSIIQAATLTVGKGSATAGLKDVASFDNSSDIALTGGATFLDVERITNSGGIVAASLTVNGNTNGLSNTGNIDAAEAHLNRLGESTNSGRWSSKLIALNESGKFVNSGDLTGRQIRIAGGQGLDNQGRLEATDFDARNAMQLTNAVAGQWSTTNVLTLSGLTSLRNQGRMVLGRVEGERVVTFDNQSELSLLRGGSLQGDTFSSTRNLYARQALTVDVDRADLSGDLDAATVSLMAKTVAMSTLNAKLAALTVNAKTSLDVQQTHIQSEGLLAMETPSLAVSRNSSLQADSLQVLAARQRYDNLDVRARNASLHGQDAHSTLEAQNMHLQASASLDIRDLASLDLTGNHLGGQALNIRDVKSLSTKADSTLSFVQAEISGVQTLTNAGVLGADDLTLNRIARLDNGGSLVAAKTTVISNVTALNNTGEFFAKQTSGTGNDSVENSGKMYLNGGQMSFQRWDNQATLLGENAVLAYTSLTNQASGTIGGAGTLTALGKEGSSLINHGRIESRGDLDLLGQTLQNAGALVVHGNLTLGRRAGELDSATVSFRNQVGGGSVMVGGNLIAGVDQFDSKATFSTQTERRTTTEFPASGTYGSCKSSGIGSCRNDVNVVGKASLVWYGSAGTIPVYGILGRNGANVTTTTTSINRSTYRDAPIRVGGNLHASGKGSGSYFDTYAATLDVGGTASKTGYSHVNDNSYGETTRVEKAYFTDIYYCYSDVACVNPNGTNKYIRRENSSRDGLSNSDVTSTTGHTGGLRTVAMANTPTPTVDLPAGSRTAATLPGATGVTVDLASISVGAAVPAAAVVTTTPLLEGPARPPAPPMPAVPVLAGIPVLPQAPVISGLPADWVSSGGTVAQPQPAQRPLTVQASEFVFPSIPGELPAEQKLPVITDDEEARFDDIHRIRPREDRENRSCFSVFQGDDMTSFTNNLTRPVPNCETRVIYPESRVRLRQRP